MLFKERPQLNLEGERLALGPLRRDLIPAYQTWMNDFETLRGLARPPLPVTEEAQVEWYERVAKSSEENAVFTIFLREADGWRAIGNCGLHEIDMRHQRATFGIVIGSQEHRGRGYGTEATRLMLQYAFVERGLRNVMLTVYSFNERAIACYKRAGFREIGRRRQARCSGGQWHDEVFMDILAGELVRT